MIEKNLEPIDVASLIVAILEPSYDVEDYKKTEEEKLEIESLKSQIKEIYIKNKSTNDFTSSGIDAKIEVITDILERYIACIFQEYEEAALVSSKEK